MVKSFVQILNVGFGIINNTQPIEDKNIEVIMEQVLEQDDAAKDIRIIGFRTYDMDPDTGLMSNQSGIYYLEGEEFTYPKVDPEITTYMKTSGIDFEKGQQIIKIKKPNVIVRPFNADDQILDTNNQFNTIPLVDTGENSKALNLLGDKGNFQKHIEHMRNIRVEIMSIDKFLRENQI